MGVVWIRAGATAFAATLILAAAAPAWACDRPAKDDEDVVSAGPGDAVPFEIPCTDRGDTYTITLDEPGGETVAEGEDMDSKPGVSGDFRMPDLGDEDHLVEFEMNVFRSEGRAGPARDGDGPGEASELTLQVRYLGGRAPQPSAAPRQPAPAATRPAPDHDTGSAPSPASSVTAPPKLPPASSPPGEPAGEESPAREAARDSAAVLGAVRAAVGPPQRSTQRVPRKAERHPRPPKGQTDRYGDTALPPASRPRKLSPPEDTRVDLSRNPYAGLGYRVAWELLLVVALIGLLLPLGLGVLARRRKRETDRRDREIEAELQEIVAEERARQSAWR